EAQCSRTRQWPEPAVGRENHDGRVIDLTTTNIEDSSVDRRALRCECDDRSGKITAFDDERLQHQIAPVQRDRRQGPGAVSAVVPCAQKPATSGQTDHVELASL